MTKEYDEALNQLHKDVDTGNLTNVSALELALKVAKLDEKERITFVEHLYDLNEKELVRLRNQTNHERENPERTDKIRTEW